MNQLEFEKKVGYPVRLIAGVDEVGRGCLAGPVVAAAVVLPQDLSPEFLKEITDSKLLNAKKRQGLFEKIQNWAADFCIARAEVEEIDRLNIYHASLLAMDRAVAGLKRNPPDHILVDGNALPPGLKGRSTAIIKGDLKCLSIGAASILAKVYRDQLLVEFDSQYPGYGLSGHKGYPTKMHVEALLKLGVTPIHRKSFGPVASLLHPPVQNEIFS